MANKKETAEQEAEEQAFLAKQVKEPLHHPKKSKADAEGTIQPREGEEFLPPPDPPVVPSPPFPPPAFDAVDESEKGAQPEATAVRELELLQVGTRGEGPAPEPETPPPPPEGELP